jgi:thiosulfate/3-mercaptopyruvate sulfurtransferase
MKPFHAHFLLLLVFVAPVPAPAAKVPGPLVDTAWLRSHAKEVMILDVRHDLRSFTAQPKFSADPKTGQRRLVRIGGHVPGAALIDFRRIRVTRQVHGRKVRHLIPDQADFERIMQQAGVNQDSTLVIMSKGASNSDIAMAARLYWQLKYFGHDDMAILDGGLFQWISDGHPVSSDPSTGGSGNWQARAERQEIFASSEEVASAGAAGAGQLVDNRSLSQYLGTWKAAYVDQKGHIPGAKAFPIELMTQARGPARFLPVSELRQLLQQMGVDVDRNAITYCNSGHLAAGGWFILSELLGNQGVELYDGSMHQWALEQRPVTTLKME